MTTDIYRNAQLWETLPNGCVLVYRDAHTAIEWNLSATFNVFGRYGINTECFTRYGVSSLADASMVATEWANTSAECAACVDAADMKAQGWTDYYCRVHGIPVN